MKMNQEEMASFLFEITNIPCIIRSRLLYLFKKEIFVAQRKKFVLLRINPNYSLEIVFKCFQTFNK